jgi:hypothetical protein
VDLAAARGVVVVMTDRRLKAVPMVDDVVA